MASTIYSYSLTAGRTKFPVSFEYLARRFVKVTLVGDTRLELVLNVDYRFTSKMEIETTVAWLPGDYLTLEVRRVTSATDRLVNFTDGSILRSQDLNISQIQAVHIAEEARDVSAMALINNGISWNALGLPITNVGYSDDPQHAATVGYANEQLGKALRASESLEVLPPAASRALQVLGFDSRGQPVMVSPQGGSGLSLEMALMDPLQGARKVAWKRSTIRLALDSVQGALDRTSVHLEEFSEFADKTIPSDWDWAPALQRALDTGASINIGTMKYRVSKRSSYTTPGQTVFGYGGELYSSGSGIDATVLYAEGLKKVKAVNLTLKPGSVTGGLWTSGSAVHFHNCEQITMTGNDVYGGRRGLSVSDCRGGIVHANHVHDSLVKESPSTATQFGADIGVYNSCSDIIVTHNVCARGNGQGIAVQTNGQTGHRMKNIIVGFNAVSDQDAYGILVYSDGANSAGLNPDIFEGVVLVGNAVEDITGLIPNPFDSSLSFGAGVYIQGAEGVHAATNVVKRANLNTTSALLAPAGFGVTNALNVILMGNTAEDCGKHGFFITDPLKKGKAGGEATLIGNKSRRNKEHGFFFNDFPEASLSSNTAEANIGMGFFCRDQGTTQSRVFTFSANISARNGQNGFTVANGDSIFLGNIATSNAGGGISVQKGTTIISLNTMRGNAGRGLEIAAGVVDAVSNTNTLDANKVQLYLMAPVRDLMSNIIKNTPSGGVDYAGDFGIETAITGATPNVKHGRYFVKNDATSVTSLVGQTQGQEVTIRAGVAFTLINGGQIATATGADVNVIQGRSITLRYIASAWRQSI